MMVNNFIANCVDEKVGKLVGQRGILMNYTNKK